MNLDLLFLRMGEAEQGSARRPSVPSGSPWVGTVLEKVQKARQLPYPREEAKAGEGSNVIVSQLAGVSCPHTQASGAQSRALGSLGLRGQGTCQGPSSPAVNGGSAMCGIPYSYSVHMGGGMGGRPSASLGEPLEQDTSPTFIRLSWIR